MSTFGKSDNNGGFIVFAYFQASSSGYEPSIEIDIYDWQKTFWAKHSNVRGEYPVPIMVGNSPYWRGVDPGWNKPDVISGDAKNEKVFVGGFDLKTYRVAERHVRLPNDEEYIKYFEKAVDAGTFCLRAQRGGYVMARNWTTLKRRKERNKK